jgi:hypothetical protein
VRNVSANGRMYVRVFLGISKFVYFNINVDVMQVYVLVPTSLSYPVFGGSNFFDSLLVFLVVFVFILYQEAFA